MKLVIEIPKKFYDNIVNNIYDYGDMNLIIQNGAPLPNGHGRLIDADELKYKMHMDGYAGFATYHDVEKCFYYINDVPTIIEADAENEVR